MKAEEDQKLKIREENLRLLKERERNNIIPYIFSITKQPRLQIWQNPEISYKIKELEGRA